MRAMDLSSAWHSATSRSYVWSPTVAETLCVFLSILGRAIARSIARCQIRVSCINLVDAWVVRYGAEVCFAKLAVVSLKTDGFSGSEMVAFKATLWRTAWPPENRGATPYPFLFYRTMGS